MDLLQIFEEIKEDFHYNVKILALKAKKAMKLQEKDGTQIADLFFPTSMYNYLIRDLQLEIISTCDKIKITEGRYYPVKMSLSKNHQRRGFEIVIRLN